MDFYRQKKQLNHYNLKNLKNKKKFIYMFVIFDFSKTKKILHKIKPKIIFHLASNADVLDLFQTL